VVTLKFPPLHEAVFCGRPNRFVVECEVDGQETLASLPNPGRLLELFRPGVRLMVTEPASEKAKLPYKVVGVYRDGTPIMLDTHRANDAVGFCLENKLFPGLEGATVKRREVTWHRSRFDFLLEEDGREIYLEVKSCTLFAGTVAMFPDAITARGRKHILELAELADRGCRTMVLFLVQWSKADFFLPDYHTDLAFSEAMMAVKDRVDIRPYGIGWTEKLTIGTKPRLLPIPWHLVEREGRDGGCYLILLHNVDDQEITVGKLGAIKFSSGFYVYVGSARQHLEARINRHRRLRKNHHWHTDYLRNQTQFIQAFPIRTADDLECNVAQSLSLLCDRSIARFGCSDCSCDSHLFAFDDDPRQSKAFVDLLLRFRMERLTDFYSPDADR
jgi:sugar fermentation stimulation protein A